MGAGDGWLPIPAPPAGRKGAEPGHLLLLLLPPAPLFAFVVLVLWLLLRRLAQAVAARSKARHWQAVALHRRALRDTQVSLEGLWEGLVPMCVGVCVIGGPDQAE
jgi:hypothetical protein